MKSRPTVATRLGDGDLLDAPDVADLPVTLRAFGMRVVAVHARLPHDHRSDEPDTVAEQRARHVAQCLARIFAQTMQRVGLEGVERMRRAVGERKIRHEPIGDVVLLLADDFAEFERERGRDGNGAGNVLVVVHDLGRRSRCGKNAADHVAGVVAAYAADDRVQVARLAAQIGIGQVAQVQPDRDRQPGKQQDHEEDERVQLMVTPEAFFMVHLPCDSRDLRPSCFARGTPTSGLQSTAELGAAPLSS